jgi:predicted GTPase
MFLLVLPLLLLDKEKGKLDAILSLSKGDDEVSLIFKSPFPEKRKGTKGDEFAPPKDQRLLLHKQLEETPMPKPTPRRVLIMGAAGRDFHNFNMVFRHNPAYRVVAFTAAQIPGIAGRQYPPALAGPLYPNGIPILPEADLEVLIKRHRIDQVYFSYSDVPHIQVMHHASRALASGASFGLLGPNQTMLPSPKPVIAVTAVRTGSGKSPLSQFIAAWFRDRGFRPAVLRHPMPYGDLEKQAVQRFASFDDLEAADVTVEEREEYEPYVCMGVPIFAGVDYARILEMAEPEADLILWDGGNNDFPFIRPHLHIVVLDPHRAGHETSYHPGETNFRAAHAYVINKVNSASRVQVSKLRRAVRSIKRRAPIVLADSELVVDNPDAISGRRVVIVGDGPTLTHGGMAYGAGLLAAQQYNAREVVSAQPHAVGSLAETFAEFPHLKDEVPAMGYSTAQLRDLEATLNQTPTDVVLDATPADLSRLIRVNKPIINVEYRFQERDGAMTRLLERFVRGRLSVHSRAAIG